MRLVAVIILITVKEFQIKLAVNAQDSLDRQVDKLLEHALNDLPLHFADLDSTMLEKPGHLAFGLRPSVSSSFFPLSPPFLHGARLGFHPCVKASGLPQQKIAQHLDQFADTSVQIETGLPTRNDLLQLSKEELKDVLVDLGAPTYRTKQVLDWVYDKGETDFHRMSNLPKKLQSALSERLDVSGFEVAAEQESKDGTVKRALRLRDGQLIESVLMPYRDGRRTACISSQAGCGMRCAFCATGQMGFARQLSAGEIFAQAAEFSCALRKRGERLSNVVFMGMGEPLANYQNVMEAVRRINRDLGIGARHITISTVGLAPRIRKLVQDVTTKVVPPVTLAVSLHASTDAKRSSMMPVNDCWNLNELLAACKEYTTVNSQRMTFEWALIEKENDSAGEADRLATLLINAGLKGLCHVNVIPLNPTGGYGGRPSQAQRVNNFLATLENRGIPATARVRRGIDIDAGCGQLKSEVQKKEKVQAKEAPTPSSQ